MLLSSQNSRDFRNKKIDAQASCCVVCRVYVHRHNSGCLGTGRDRQGRHPQRRACIVLRRPNHAHATTIVDSSLGIRVVVATRQLGSVANIWMQLPMRRQLTVDLIGHLLGETCVQLICI